MDVLYANLLSLSSTVTLQSQASSHVILNVQVLPLDNQQLQTFVLTLVQLDLDRNYLIEHAISALRLLQDAALARTPMECGHVPLVPALLPSLMLTELSAMQLVLQERLLMQSIKFVILALQTVLHVHSQMGQ